MKKLSDIWMYYCGLLIGMGLNVDVEDLKHIQNLIDAEEQGRLFVLPCTVGDKLYDIRQDNVKNRKNDMIHELNVAGIDIKFVPWETCMAKDVRLEDIGKTVFTTIEEAEVAMKKLKGEEHD